MSASMWVVELDESAAPEVARFWPVAVFSSLDEAQDWIMGRTPAGMIAWDWQLEFPSPLRDGATIEVYWTDDGPLWRIVEVLAAKTEEA
jgi:hypothetical protein